MTTAQEKFQSLLRTLFQFDSADLDFGIYRIMNYKRDVIEKFISTDLPALIGAELNRAALAAQSQAAAKLAETKDEIVKSLGKDVLDAEGNLVKFQETKIGQEYLRLQAKAAGGRGREALEAAIYNHLYTFFSRYYQDGDFISKRRYSRRQKYAIPYNGEEVYLYWANHDQYYIKTAEHFHDYTFTSQGVTVHFKMTAANIEQNNVKGDKRFFLPRIEEIDWWEKTNELVIPFEYRPLTEQEKKTYGNKKQQEKIIAKAVETIPGQLSSREHGKVRIALMAERRRDSDNRPVTFLEHHLRKYTRRNTSDFFIHKNLKGFLSRELDFYLKNEVLNLDEMEAAGENRAEGWFQILRVIKTVGSGIIDFLAQIEDFQKILWEKKKFVTETFYCITVGHISDAFYPEIAANEAQWAEWKALYHIHELEKDLFSGDLKTEAGRITFLEAHPTLVLDTRHFDRDFTDRLLSTFENLDEMTDGLLVHSENWQALNLLLEKYRKRVKTIYIDPPYNTGSDEFIYRDNYQHSSWLAMMVDRLQTSYMLLKDDGLYCVNVDDQEQAYLLVLLKRIFGEEGFLANVSWQKRFTRNNNAKLFSTVKDYLLCFRRSVQLEMLREPRTEESNAIYSNPDNDPRGPWTSVSYVNPVRKGQRPNLVYKIENPYTGQLIEHSTNAWKYSYEEHLRHVGEHRLYWGQRGENLYPRLKRFLSEVGGLVPVDIWEYESTGTTDEASISLQHVFGSKVFDNPKPTRLIERIGHLLLNNLPSSCGIFLDYFAGSGTTGHAVINLNREDGGRRKFLLVEMADYFDTVLLPRLKKVTFTPAWKNGQPKRLATPEEAERSPRVVKVLRLESYEDALNNIAFDDTSDKYAFRFDDYLLKYMLKWETRKSETLLNVEELASPFSYKLTVAKGDATIDKTVDIPETFNYLLGLHVETRKVYDDDGKRYLVYRGHIDHRAIAVIWRETAGWQKDDFERDKQFVAQQNLAAGADEVFVNGDSFIPNAKSLEPLFKARMFAQMEA